MRYQDILLGIAVACLMGFICADAKTIFRRADKISHPFQRLNLPPEEIDPNVAPPEPQKIETLNSEDVSGFGNDETTQFPDDIVDQAEESVALANEVGDEAVNEIEDAVTAAPIDATPAVTSPLASPAVTSSSSASSATDATTLQSQDDNNPISKYCKCTDDHCDCCRQFNLPLIPVRGPGCAKITYLGDERMSVSLKYGDITLATRTISGKRAKPICVGLPGGYSKFCGRVYGLSRTKNDFKACLGFELRAEDEVEAALRVSCFKFGPEGLRVADAEPLPTEGNKDDDDDDIFGFGAGGDDDDDDYDDETEEADEVDDEDDEGDEDDEAEDDDEVEAEAPADADYGGFSLAGLLDELADDDDEKPGPAVSVAPALRSAEHKDTAQGKDNEVTDLAEESGQIPIVSAGENSAVIPIPAGADTTKVKPTKKSKKTRKQKKKKAVSTGENDFAIEILNGILDFFN
ncbi:uncharacterized protein LOC128858537 [Anastrepha ludens]|uniref:uncharacterized protein LOC128858537 n=1 Tax=Anastrepha ludens TaxID=28586 RepID=UPI0023AF2E6F|nr:uncharacterized protein LOC128858537 [Anastrepha ludens]XP_053950884.1 uncharacterized protein LOC128858537 [Anastrepha ludens]